MAASLMNRLTSEGIEVNSVAAQWMKGSKDVSVNYSYYKSASMMSKASQDIIEFSVPRSELDLLKTKTFASANAEWASFVRANKTGSPIDIGDVDMIVGPMCGRVNSKGVMQQLGNRTQTSVHSQTAAEIFNYYMVRD